MGAGPVTAQILQAVTPFLLLFGCELFSRQFGFAIKEDIVSKMSGAHEEAAGFEVLLML